MALNLREIAPVGKDFKGNHLKQDKMIKFLANHYDDKILNYLGFNRSLKGYSLRHDHIALDIRLRCWPRVLKVNEQRRVINIKAEYTANHNEIAKPYSPTLCHQQPLKCRLQPLC